MTPLFAYCQAERIGPRGSFCFPLSSSFGLVASFSSLRPLLFANLSSFFFPSSISNRGSPTLRRPNPSPILRSRSFRQPRIHFLLFPIHLLPASTSYPSRSTASRPPAAPAPTPPSAAARRTLHSSHSHFLQPQPQPQPLRSQPSSLPPQPQRSHSLLRPTATAATTLYPFCVHSNQSLGCNDRATLTRRSSSRSFENDHLPQEKGVDLG